MVWGLVWTWDKSRESWGGLEDPFLTGWFYYRGTAIWFCNLGRDYPFLGHDSREGSCRG